jgi:hypothetical protein
VRHILAVSWEISESCYLEEEEEEEDDVFHLN